MVKRANNKWLRGGGAFDLRPATSRRCRPSSYLAFFFFFLHFLDLLLYFLCLLLSCVFGTCTFSGLQPPTSLSCFFFCMLWILDFHLVFFSVVLGYLSLMGAYIWLFAWARVIQQSGGRHAASCRERPATPPIDSSSAMFCCKRMLLDVVDYAWICKEIE